jgi:hypothetical protein
VKRPQWVNWKSLLAIVVMIAASMGFFVVLAADRSFFSSSEPE